MVARLAIGAIVALAALSATAAPASAKSKAFVAKPSGITCVAVRLEQRSATLRCDLPFGQRRAVFLHTRGKAMIRPVPRLVRPQRRRALTRGEQERYGPFTCTSLRTAVNCRTRGGHGFTAGRSFQLTF